MKRILFILAGLVLLGVVCIYVFIPGKIVVSKSLKIEANNNALYRKLSNGATWRQWWPGNDSEREVSAIYRLNDISFIPLAARPISMPIEVATKDFTTTAELIFVPIVIDTTALQLQTTVTLSNNPFKRVNSFFTARRLESSFAEILQSLAIQYTAISSLYDFDIQKQHVVDTALVFTSAEVVGAPTVEKIYSMVDELRKYIAQQGASETGFPMKNVTTHDSTHYLVKVAVPVNRVLPETQTIKYKWMLGGGNILITEVHGGQGQINKAYMQIQHYLTDFNRIAPAIPFESMVTDRRQQGDTSKWVTRIYYPVI